jgi:hypothetical protein
MSGIHRDWFERSSSAGESGRKCLSAFQPTVSKLGSVRGGFSITTTMETTAMPNRHLSVLLILDMLLMCPGKPQGPCSLSGDGVAIMTTISYPGGQYANPKTDWMSQTTKEVFVK